LTEKQKDRYSDKVSQYTSLSVILSDNSDPKSKRFGMLSATEKRDLTENLQEIYKEIK